MWDVGLAKLFKDRDNKSKIGPCVGTIAETNPLKVSILGGQIILQESNLIKCNHVNDLIKNDDVLIIPAEDERVFFIAGRVGG